MEALGGVRAKVVTALVIATTFVVGCGGEGQSAADRAREEDAIKAICKAVVVLDSGYREALNVAGAEGLENSEPGALDEGLVSHLMAVSAWAEAQAVAGLEWPSDQPDYMDAEFAAIAAEAQGVRDASLGDASLASGLTRVMTACVETS